MNGNMFSTCTDASAACDPPLNATAEGGGLCKLLPPLSRAHLREQLREREAFGQVASRQAEPEQVCELAGKQVTHCLVSTRVKTM